MLTAYRSGMRVWIGEGVNRARTLLMGMLDRRVYLRGARTNVRLAGRPVPAGE